MTDEEIKYIVSDDNLWADYTQERFLYLSNDTDDKKLLKARKEFVAKRNKEKKLKPYYDKDYYCDTCGEKDGACDPDTGYCFHCNSDNWHPVDYQIDR